MNSIVATPYLTALHQIHAPAWLEKTRRTALARFLKQGLPSPREEDWHYTSLSHLENIHLHAPDHERLVMPTIENYPGTLLSYVDDHLVWREISRPVDAVGSLLGMAETEPLRSLLGAQVGTAALALLNSALWQDGACLHVPAGARLRQPVFLHFAAAEAEAMLYPRVLVVMETGADAVLVEHYTGDAAAPYWQNAVTEIVLERGARLTHLKFTEDGAASTHTSLVAVHQERDSSYRGLVINLGGRVARHELNVDLRGEGADARLDGLFIADGRRQADHHLRVEHRAPNTTSRTTYRGMAAGHGRGVFDGRVVVHAGAHHTDALQSSHNLLLSPYAEIYAKPQLEIYADDVKCGHGATVGRLDEEQLFYLRSRGIDPADAHALLLTAFANEALGLLDDAGLRAWLEPRLLTHLPTNGTVYAPQEAA